jgi:hypothetical protein
MKRRFILYHRKLGGTFYVEDTQTRKQESLGTKDRREAETRPQSATDIDDGQVNAISRLHLLWEANRKAYSH